MTCQCSLVGQVSGLPMSLPDLAHPKLSKLELQILEALWAHGKASIREIQEAFPEPRPAYTTIQTTIYRLEGKKAVRRVRKIGNAHIFEPTVARDVTRRRLLDEILSFFGGRPQPMMAQLAEARSITFGNLPCSPSQPRCWPSRSATTGPKFAIGSG
jgi:BlaI family penicillinase repressor